MKAGSAVTVLRALRGRIEVMHGLLTVGMHECYALWAAYEATDHNPKLLELLHISLASIAASQKMPALGSVGPDEYEAIRTGYKALETKAPLVEYKFPDLQELNNILSNQHPQKTKDNDPAKLPDTDAFVKMMQKMMSDNPDPSKLN